MCQANDWQYLTREDASLSVLQERKGSGNEVHERNHVRSRASSIAERLDALYEFDREPVPENKLHGPTNFNGVYTGEHVAGTEYVIGPLFVAHGVAAADVILGLLLGNFLAVLSWAFIAAPLAVRT